MGFPKTLYHEIEGAVTVADQATQDALGSAWHEGEHFFTSVVKMPHEAWAVAKAAVATSVAAGENIVDSVENTIADAADTVAKKLRKPRKPAEQQ